MVEDIGDMLEDTKSMSTSGGHTIDGEIHSILSSATLFTNANYATQVDAIDDTLGRCTKCISVTKRDMITF